MTRRCEAAMLVGVCLVDGPVVMDAMDEFGDRDEIGRVLSWP
jgi:hypothetical protein